MSQDGCSASAGGDQLSVVQLSRLHERVLQLREHLRAALLAEGPQLEMIVFTSLFDLYENFYLRLFLSNASASPQTDEAAGSGGAPQASAETRFVTSAYTQDILAACLFLMNVRALPESYAVPTQPPPLETAHNADNASNVYVSSAQRHFCFLIFMYVCWSDASLPLKDVLHALYPLLDPGVTEGSAVQRDARTGAPGSAASHAENTIAVDLFAHPRFARQKCFVGETLSGLVLSRTSGVRALLRVLLLDDRVEADMTVEAAQLVVRVLTTPLTAVWMLSGEQPTSSSQVPHEVDVPANTAGEAGRRVLRVNSLSVETQVMSLAPQLLPLLEEHADEERDASSGGRSAARQPGAARPRFLARLEALHQRLPTETLEHRLHLFVTLLLNKLVKLPARKSPDFPRSYRQFFYTNKHILSPGFGCLSLRGDALCGEDDVVAALRRLTSLVKGVSLGAGTGALAHVLPATAAGLLSLCAVQSCLRSEDGVPAPEGTRRVVDAFQRLMVPLLSNPSLYELTAHALVQACAVAPPHSFVLGNAVEMTLQYSDTACTNEALSSGLAWLLFAVPPSDAGFVHVCVEAIVDACQMSLYATGVEALTSASSSGQPASSSVNNSSSADAEATPASSSSPPLVLMLERLCLEAPSAAIFGTGEQLSLASTLMLLGRLVGLSVVLYRWALGMLNALLRSDSLRAALQGDGGKISSAAGEPTHDTGDAAEEHRRLLTRLVRTAQGILSTLQMLHTTPAADGGVARMNIDGDDELMALTAEACAALKTCVTEASQRLNEYTTTCEASSLEGGGGRANNETAVTVTAQWQRLLTQLQSALDGRASVDVAMALASLSRSVDDVVHDVADPQLLLPVVQPLLLTLVRVLYESDEVGCAVRAVHCMTWLSMYRFDSIDSAYMADIVWAVLGEAQVPAWLAAHIGHVSTAATTTSTAAGRATASAARVCRLRVRLLDVLLAWTDYDDDARTLRNVDDVLRRTRHSSLYDALVRLCHNSSDVMVQVATLHFVGAYALAVHPRVPLPALCDLCRDVFRLSPHAMAKAACAAALGGVVASLCHADNNGALLSAGVDLEACLALASAMASYCGRPAGGASTTTTAAAAEVDMHDAVIQQHGRDMMKLLRQASLSLGASAGAQAPSALRVEMPNVTLK